MSAAEQAQVFLRFLTQEAKIPLNQAIPQIGRLRKKNVNTAADILAAKPDELKQVFNDEKVLKQVINAAKRTTNPKKRAQLDPAAARKRAKTDNDSCSDTEAELAFPVCSLEVSELESVTVETNRAPLFLAFTVVCIRYTHPEQPLSSCFSLAQAVVSAGAQSRAKYLGITSGPTAEEDGWAHGQPKLSIMGREVAVMRRQISQEDEKADPEVDESHTVGGSNGSEGTRPSETHEAFWGLDLEALRKANGPLIGGKAVSGQHQGPPIHLPQTARSYLLRSITLAEAPDVVQSKGRSEEKGKPKAAARADGAAAVLRALVFLFESWKSTLSSVELDRRAQSWYTTVRPEIRPGKEGWGQRGRVGIKDILKLRRMEPKVEDLLIAKSEGT